MKHFAQRLLAARNALLGTGLAALLSVAATTAPAAAQRSAADKRGAQWEIGATKTSRSGSCLLYTSPSPRDS